MNTERRFSSSSRTASEVSEPWRAHPEIDRYESMISSPYATDVLCLPWGNISEMNTTNDASP